MSLAGSDWTNSGSLQALNDVSLSLNGSWTNSGSIAVEGGNVNLDELARRQPVRPSPEPASPTST